MKFFCLSAIALLGLTADATSLRSSGTKMNKELLLSKARRLDQNGGYNYDNGYNNYNGNQNGNYNNQQNMYDYSIMFNTCLNLKVKNTEAIERDYEEQQNNNNENGYYYNNDDSTSLKYLLQDGEVVSQTSYVVFNICHADDCYYSENNSNNRYIVDLNTYVRSMSQYIPSVQEQYCEQCENNEDYCLYGANGNNNGNGDNGNNNNGYQYNANYGGYNNAANQNYIDCDKCFSQGCLAQYNNNNNGNNGEQENMYAVAAEWLEEIGECRGEDDNDNNNNNGNYNYNNGYSLGYVGNYPLTVGLTCSDDGTDIEFAPFLAVEGGGENGCTFRAINKSINDNKMSSQYYSYSYAQEIISKMTSYGNGNEAVSCMMDNTEYTNPYNYEDNNDGNNNNNGQEYEVGEWCKDLYDPDGDGDYDADGEVQNLAYCASTYDNYYGNGYYNQNGENQNQNDDNDENNNNYYYDDYSWWTDYDIDSQMVENYGMGCVCSKVVDIQNGESSSWTSGNNTVSDTFNNIADKASSVFNPKSVSYHTKDDWTKIAIIIGLALFVTIAIYQILKCMCRTLAKATGLDDDLEGDGYKLTGGSSPPPSPQRAGRYRL